MSGPTGDVLKYLLSQNGIERKDIRVTNTVLCSLPPDTTIVPPKAIKACSGRLHHDVSSAKTVIAAGAEPVKALTGMTIANARGYVHEQNGYKLVATNNPALVMRDDSIFPNLKRDFKRAFHPMPPPTFPKVEVVESVHEAEEVISDLSRRSGAVISADIESRGGLTHTATLISMQFAADSTRAYVLGEREGLWDNTDFIQGVLQPFLEQSDLRFCWHNGIFDTKVLRYSYGIGARIDEDTLLQSYVLDERPGHHALDYLLMEHFGWPNYEDAEIKKIKKTGVVTNYDKFYNYAGYDVGGTYQLYEFQRPQLIDGGLLEKPYYWPIIQAQEFLRDVELKGFKYNVEAAADLRELELQPELRNLIADLRLILNKPLFNPNSTVHMAALYYDEWKVKHALQDRPDKRRSVDDAARQEIIEGRFTFFGEAMPSANKAVLSDKRNQIIETTKQVDRYKKLARQDSQYIVSLVEQALKDPEHRIHTNLNLARTLTGRLSSTEPNLQNITRTKPDMPDIRRLFEAPQGRVIVNADYSQAELRVIAEFSRNYGTELASIYDKGLDLHSIAAERFYGADFTSEQRSKAKNMDFGVAFRQSAHTFQEKHGIPQGEGQRFIDWWWENFKGVAEWERRIERQVHDIGHLESPFVRRRRFHLLTKENVEASYREAINFLPQSTASDLTLTSAIYLSREMDNTRAAILLLVHDSVVSECDEDYVDDFTLLCRRIMESRAKEELGWDLPFTVDIGVGHTWAEAK
jgi:DNA polymerase-1